MFAAGTLSLTAQFVAGELLLRIFRYFFADFVLQIIVDATNEHATAKVVEVS
jgi:hypothetical protein